MPRNFHPGNLDYLGKIRLFSVMRTWPFAELSSTRESLMPFDFMHAHLADDPVGAPAIGGGVKKPEGGI